MRDARRLLGMFRSALPWLAVVALASWALAETAPFAALTVTPAGRQTVDLTTGATTLPDGGTVVDQDTGVTLTAATVRYLDGAYLDATGVQVEGSFGTLTADALHIDIVHGTLEAEGALHLERAGLDVTASRVDYDARREVASFAGPVRAQAPTFEADRVLLDARSGDVLLVGRYRFEDGLFTLTSPADGGRLELQLHEVDGAPVYDAATEVDPALLERFAAELD